MTATLDPVRQIAQAVLYEGYLLWPYRRSALKNQRRWTFGGVYPRPYSVARGGDDPWWMRTECLLETNPGASVDIRVRFLHVVRREVARQEPDGALVPVPELAVAGERYLSWDEAVEREVVLDRLDLDALTAAPHRTPIEVPAGQRTEWLTDHCGQRAGALTRSWQELRGRVTVGATAVAGTAFGAGPVVDGAVRLAVEVTNETPWDGTVREEALYRTLVSTHTVGHAHGASFVSLTDPPEHLRQATRECHNSGTWPVLVGADGDRDTVLSSPIILYDYPKVAPESPGDLFDASEIDQLLVLTILSLTDDEKREMRDTDPRAREILDRCAALSPQELMRLHGTMRDVRIRSWPELHEGGGSR